jgi:hypothetical protein
MGNIQDPHEQTHSFLYKVSLLLTINAILERDAVISKYITHDVLRSSHYFGKESISKCISVTQHCESTEVFNSY